jgi:hypothetical protein
MFITYLGVQNKTKKSWGLHLTAHNKTSMPWLQNQTTSKVLLHILFFLIDIQFYTKLKYNIF